MKYLQILLLSLLVCSCSGSKKAIDSLSKTSEQNTVVTKLPDVVETPPVLEPPKENEAESKIPEPPKPPKLEKVESVDDYKPEVFNHSRWNKLLLKHVTEFGNVDYKAFRENPIELRVYIDDLTHNPPNEDWLNADKLAFWINAYNALTIDLILRNYPINSIKDIKDPWDQRLWQFGDKWYNLNDIEHQILRKMNEPRIHFAIVCASESCPKLQNEAFTASKLEEQLTNATKEFLSDTSKNEIDQNDLRLSKIFKWFKKDFEQNGSLIDFLNLYSEVTISQNAKKNYKDYNWDLND
jgi:Protein of unknown function, DUF547